MYNLVEQSLAGRAVPPGISLFLRSGECAADDSTLGGEHQTEVARGKISE